MNISEFKKLIKECILEVKVKRSVKNLIKESLKDVKVEKGESLHYKMEELSNDVKKLYKDAEVVLDDAGYYNVCSCNPHHFKIYPMTDDNFTVTYMKDNTDRIKKFNLTFSALKEFITETLKTTVGNYVQKAFYSAPGSGFKIHRDGHCCNSALNIAISCNGSDWVRWYDDEVCSC